MTLEEFSAIIRELADNQILLISDEDREFVLGIALQLEMQEPIPTSYLPRVEKIYAAYQRNQYL
jgi:hypothetical protein